MPYVRKPSSLSAPAPISPIPDSWHYQCQYRYICVLWREFHRQTKVRIYCHESSRDYYIYESLSSCKDCPTILKRRIHPQLFVAMGCRNITYGCTHNMVDVKPLIPSVFPSSFTPYAELGQRPRVRNAKLIGGSLSLLKRTTTSMEGEGCGYCT